MRLIIDGYNVIRGTRRYADVADDPPAARERLIADLGARAAEGDDVRIVFDGAGNPASDGTPRCVGGVTVIFSPSGVDADSVIEALAADARREGVETLVVTSDAATRWTSVGGTVTVSRSHLFADELHLDERDWAEHARRDSRRSTLGDRLHPDVRTTMDRLRHGRRGSAGPGGEG